VGFDRNPAFGRARSAESDDDDELSRTYTGVVVQLEAESLSAAGPSKELLNQMVAWMGLARPRLVALHKAEVALRFPVLEERVRNLKLLVIGQWAAILFLAGLVFKT